jgi:hypothetical protein
MWSENGEENPRILIFDHRINPPPFSLRDERSFSFFSSLSQKKAHPE